MLLHYRPNTIARTNTNLVLVLVTNTSTNNG